MQNLRKQKQKTLNKSNYDKAQALDFVLSGIGCNCLLTLSQTGILDTLLQDKSLHIHDIQNCKHPALLKSVILTLIGCSILYFNDAEIKITEFGIEVAKYLGLVSMLFDGYGNLMANQNQIINNHQKKPEKLIRGAAVSKAATSLANNFFNPIVINEFLSLKFKGTICDLGCGYGEMLSKICSATGNPGLGFDSEPSVIRLAKIQLKGTSVDVEQGDISKLKGVWEDIVCLMQCHVFHDFTPNEACIELMNSYLINFPNLKYFIFIDTVTPTFENPSLLPGFDYVHGLLSIQTRTYKETLDMFSHTNYNLLKEVPVPGLPSTFLWVLSKKQKAQKRRP